MITNGHYFRITLTALGLGPDERASRTNASEIIAACMSAYGTDDGGSLVSGRRLRNALATGLVYGRIQSGKTRAMITSTAMAFDNGFRISVVLTSNINDLVDQTHLDFTRGLPGIVTVTKDHDLDREVRNTRLHLERNDGRLLIICSKGSSSLTNISSFLGDVRGSRYPAIIFDDEGDQASLDTNIRRRTRSGVAVAASAINDIIQNQLRTAIPNHVYVSVTGTPQAVLLQSADSANRPSFIKMLPPGTGYVGGERFFQEDEPEDNSAIISLIDQHEQAQLLDASQPIPLGIKQSLLFFLVSASAAIENLGLPERGYSYLCHPSLKNDEQAVAETRINDFLSEVLDAVIDNRGPILRDLRTAYENLRSTLGRNTPTLDMLLATIRNQLPSRSILVINARVKRQGIRYGRGLNFLIGGNTLGRGIAIKDLLVTYYVRTARTSQIDTMHQHARMYGYREQTLAYTRLFVPRHLYYKFRDIYASDSDLRQFIHDHINNLPNTFPIECQANLRATRPGVLHANEVDAVHAGRQIYPNFIALPQSSRRFDRVRLLLASHFGASSDRLSDIASASTNETLIEWDDAAEMVRLIKTNSTSTWNDRTIATVIEKVCEWLDAPLVLKYRSARRTIREGGFISTGTLSGDEVREGQRRRRATLWIMSVTTTSGSSGGSGQQFMYPTLIIPRRFPRLFMFNRG